MVVSSIYRRILLALALSCCGVTILLFYPKPSVINCSTFTECQNAVNQLFVSMILEDDSDNMFHYLRVIREHFLKPPPPPEKQLKLHWGVWKSPVTKLVLKLLSRKRYGFFVEAGALNGEEISNSLELEVNFEWDGLLVEPDPRNLVQLYRKNRKSWISPVCLSPTRSPQKLEMLMYNRFRHMTNILELFHSNDAPKDNATTFQVQCLPLFSLLLALNRTDIDYLSLDVEGAELSVLQTIPFDKVTIKVISVEMNKKDEIFKFLESKGYKLQQIFDLPNAGVRDAVFYYP